jgi:hypothetical protein
MSPTNLKSVYRVEWTSTTTFVAINDEIVTHHGIDIVGHKYYKTAQNTYIKFAEAVGWVKIT